MLGVCPQGMDRCTAALRCGQVLGLLARNTRVAQAPSL